MMVCQGHGPAVIGKLIESGRAARVRPTYQLAPIATRCAFGDCVADRNPGSTLCATHND